MILLSQDDGRAQIGLGGVNAVMTVPTANIQQDGYLAVGFGYIPRPYAVLAGWCCDDLPYFATLGFLPFLEISLRATLSPNDDRTGIGDRMASVRVQFLREARYRPALVLGIHDAIAIQGRKAWFQALYGVVTKTLSASKHLDIETTLGHGFDWLEAYYHEFDGLFGGVSLGYRKLIFIKGEYDATKFNFGLGLQAKRLLTTNLVLLNGRTLAYGANLQIRL
jgi:hypothetical protein